MPELPEVESLARFVAARAAGRRFERIEVLSFAAVKTASPPPSALVGRTIATAMRRGKWFLVETAAGNRAAGNRATGEDGAGIDGQARLFLAVHFSRAGWLAWHDAPAAVRVGAPANGGGSGSAAGARAASDPSLRAAPRAAARLPGRSPLAFRATLDDGAGFDLTEAGTQKRLAIHVVGAPEDVERIRTLGPDPLDASFDADALGSILAGRTGRIKYVLSDQALLAGVGNAYSDEALHAARLSPFKPAANLTHDEVERLHDALVLLLREAVARSAGLPASGLKADKKSSMRVHGRTGLACPVCGDTVREVSFADRSLQYCPTCQTGGRPLADRRLSRLLK